ncbi:DNA primase [bacterium]|nr:DNA primase [bacterium]|tara:strand:+ start:276 stop:2126 length:1851 start_codon:yes stop_codon:yes gene_type:complete
MPTPAEEVKTRLDIVDVISEYVRLKASGINHKGLCPFHSEKTPSFMVSKDKQIWHCFGCSEGGDVISFIQKIEGMEFPEALRMLAERAGVTLRRVNPQEISQRQKLLEITNLASRYWHKLLLDHPAAEPVRKYLKSRHVDQAMIEEFQLGWAPDAWENLLKFLNDRKFKTEDIFLAGLLVKKDRGTGFYDRFRDRLMFPIHDAHNRVIGFGGRTMKSQEEGAKYINTPQSFVYDKSSVLYNLHRAKTAAKEAKQIVLVEGYMDVIAAWQAGTKNVVSVSGTALTPDQIKLIKRFTNTAVLAFDTDAAGQTAARRGIDLALSADLSLKVIFLPSGKDPDDLIQTDKSAWLKAVAEAGTIMDYYFEQVRSTYDLNEVDGKKSAAKILLSVIAKLPDKVEQAHWLQQLATLLNVPESFLYESLPRPKNNNYSPPSSVSSAEPKDSLAAKKTNKASSSDTLGAAERLVALALNNPETIITLQKKLPVELITDEILKNLYKQLNIYYTKQSKLPQATGEGALSAAASFNYDEFVAGLGDSERLLAGKLSLLAVRDYAELDKASILEEVNLLLSHQRRNYLLGQLQILATSFKQAEAAQDKQKLSLLSKEFNKVTKELSGIE